MLDSQLSAFLDGELPSGEMELFVRRLERDAQLKAEFGRLALIGEVMRMPANTPGTMASPGFATRVSLALDAEGAHVTAPQAPAAPAVRWMKPAAGLSIAAGVAALAVAFLGVEPDAPQLVATPAAEETLQAAASDPVQDPALEASYIVPEIAVTGPLVPAARLTNYVMAHSEYSSPLGRRNVLSGMLADEGGGVDGSVPVGFVPDPAPAVERQ